MPDPRLEEALREAYASAPVSRIIYHTLEFRHPNFRDESNNPTAIRVYLGYDTLTAGLELDAPQRPGEYVEFIGLQFEFSLPNVENIAVPEMTISMDNVDRSIEDNLALASSSPYKIEVTYRPYLDNDLSAPQMNPPITMTVISAEADDFRVNVRCSYGNASNKSCPSENYTLERFPGLRRA